MKLNPATPESIQPLPLGEYLEDNARQAAVLLRSLKNNSELSARLMLPAAGQELITPSSERHQHLQLERHVGGYLPVRKSQRVGVKSTLVNYHGLDFYFNARRQDADQRWNVLWQIGLISELESEQGPETLAVLRGAYYVQPPESGLSLRPLGVVAESEFDLNELSAPARQSLRQIITRPTSVDTSGVSL